MPASRYKNRDGINFIPVFVYFWFMQYYIYILYSELRDRYYIGSSSNPEARLIRHNAGATPSTKSGRPWIIVYIEHCASKSESLKREKYLKKMKSRVFLEYLITDLK
jgi:putative endonuclease